MRVWNWRSALLTLAVYLVSLAVLLLLGVTLGLNEYLVVAVTVVIALPVVMAVIRSSRKRTRQAATNES